MQYRHGDLLIQKIDSIPEGATRLKHSTLADGEATGHAHTIERPSSATLYEKDGKLYLNVRKDTAVVHQEHARIPLAPGVYGVDRQVEYQPAAAPRQVRD